MAGIYFTNDDANSPVKFEAAFSDEDMERLEVASSSKVRGMQRRLCLVACARNAEALRKLRDTEPDAFEEMFDMVEAFREHTKGLVEMAESAYERMICVGLESEKPSLI